MADVSLKNVYKTFEKTEVVHGISCDIKDGEFIVILGPSGCGKSTLLRMVAGLEVITKGEISIDGAVVNNLEPADRDIAMVFQNYALYPHMTVYKNMAYGLKIRKMPKNEIEKRVFEAAKILELTEFLNRKPRQLSGGQRQRVAMGRCIVREPKIFLFDEPLSNLPKHVDMHVTPGIDMSTGALGQGLSIAVGMALAAKLNKKSYFIYALLGDGEMASGQIWEAAMSAPKFGLDNLIATVDRNRLQVDGNTDSDEKIMPLEPLVDKWKSFGWNVMEIDGHDFEEILEAYSKAKLIKGKPSVIIANTIKGKGVSFMENNCSWHHSTITTEQVESALVEIEQDIKR